MNSFLPTKRRATAPGWIWTAANIGLALVVALLVTFVWLSHRWELDEQRRSLIADILWAGQNFNFHLRDDQESLVALGQEAVARGLSPRDFERRVQHLLSNNPELEQSTLLDSRGERAMMFPGSGHADSGLPPAVRDAQATALRLGKPVYSAIFPVDSGEMHFALAAPIFRDGVVAGQIIGEYSLPEMVRHLVPWWYAEKYQLAVLDASGAVLATKSNVKVDDPYLTYDVPLDPPGDGMTLRATAYPTEGSLTRNLFLAGIVILSMAMLWSLVALRRDMCRRVEAENQLRSQHAF